jgi:hypothetical protein
MLTINIDPDLLDLLKDEKRNREKAGQTGVTVGGLISEAVVKAYGGK